MIYASLFVSLIQKANRQNINRKYKLKEKQLLTDFRASVGLSALNCIKRAIQLMFLRTTTQHWWWHFPNERVV